MPIIEATSHPARPEDESQQIFEEAYYQVLVPTLIEVWGHLPDGTLKWSEDDMEPHFWGKPKWARNMPDLTIQIACKRGPTTFRGTEELGDILKARLDERFKGRGVHFGVKCILQDASYKDVPATYT